MNKNVNVHFRKVDESQKKNKLLVIKSNNIQITTWIKGQDYREEFVVNHVNLEKLIIELTSTEKSKLIDNEVLFSFEIQGMNYFGKSLLKNISDNKYNIDFNGDLFKSERRSSYRLLTYPTYKIFANFQTNKKYQGSNIVNLKTGQSETGLFRNFLKLLSSNVSSNDGDINVRVQDISVSGISLNIGEYEKDYLNKDDIIDNLKIDFLGEEFVIPTSKVIYKIDLIDGKSNTKMYKVGIEFQELPMEVDNLLGIQLNRVLRENEENLDFEDFIK